MNPSNCNQQPTPKCAYRWQRGGQWRARAQADVADQLLTPSSLQSNVDRKSYREAWTRSWNEILGRTRSTHRNWWWRLFGLIRARQDPRTEDARQPVLSR